MLLKYLGFLYPNWDQQFVEILWILEQCISYIAYSVPHEFIAMYSIVSTWINRNKIRWNNFQSTLYVIPIIETIESKMRGIPNNSYKRSINFLSHNELPVIRACAKLMIHENGNSVALGRKPVKGLTIHLKLIRNTFHSNDLEII